jgi:hypothetical protein
VRKLSILKQFEEGKRCQRELLQEQNIRRHFSAEMRVEEETMAKYGKAAGKSVKSAMHRKKKGTLKSGKGGKGGKVTSRKQAIAIGLSEGREKGAKVPPKKK